MKQFGEQLTIESLEALTALCNANIQFILSCAADVEVGSAVIMVTELSIPIGRDAFVIIENDWADTPREGLDYYSLSARVASSPHQMFFDPAPGPGGFSYKADHFSLHLGATAPVARVEVLSAFEAGSEESVSYDAGLVVTRGDGLQLAIVRKEGILGALHLAHTPSSIEELLVGLDVRTVLER